ncbi:unnamed protein product [Cylindrotheca closterium]|uniref:DUF1995 domain-containing protein n=1 Tax=Cylindrotheca closterium TaxID=2856 RepID=A0AAD2GBZ0_9STRA|nr:unnamed protein product [Cylindrotheca closterium]
MTLPIMMSTEILLLLLLLLYCEAYSVGGFSHSPASVPKLPENPEDVARQASASIQRAVLDGGIHRQTIRLPLSESMYARKEESFVADRAIGWQGGPQETYRFVSPMTESVLRQISLNDDKNSGLTPKIQRQILLDFDGSALLNAQSPMGALYDSLALVQPNTDNYYMELIEKVENEFSDTPGKAKRLFLLINPAWKDDPSSWGIFQSKKAKDKILDRYETTFALDQFIVKGNKISLFKSYPFDWTAYWTQLRPSGTRESDDSSIEGATLLGSMPKRPTYLEVENMLDSAMAARS